MSNNHFCIEMQLPQRPAARKRDVNVRSANIGPQRAAFFTSKLWPNGTTLRVRFLGGTAKQQEFVKKTMVEWSKYANIHFTFLLRPATSDIRISFVEGQGSWSYIGTDNRSIPQNAATMNLGWLDKKKPDDAGTVLHETGHAIGLTHEHMRPGAFQWNRDAVIKDLSGEPNFWSVAQIEENVLSKLQAKDLTATATIDDHSIMMYSFPAAWTVDGHGTVTNDVLSADDKALAARVYPEKKKPVKKPTKRAEGEEEDDPDADIFETGEEEEEQGGEEQAEEKGEEEESEKEKGNGTRCGCLGCFVVCK